jgi:ribosomal protein S18 acetylase RimI-like enzyme
MPIEVVIRRPQPYEYDSVRGLIEIVATETFKDLFAPNPVPLEFKDEDWPLAWLAVSDAKILGVIITNHEWVDDLWVLREHRRQGVGTRLLRQGESEIASRGCHSCRLRVVWSNLIAIQF